MSHRRRRSSAYALAALGTATLTLVGVVPGSSSAEPTQSISEVRKQVDRLYEHAEKVTEQANALGDQVSAIDRRVHTLTTDVRRQQRQVGTMRGDIGAFAAAQYRSGGISSTVQVLAAKDPDEFLARMSTVKAFSAQRADLLLRLQQGEKRLAEQQSTRQAELSRLRAAKAKVDARRKTALGNAAKAKAILDRLTAEERRRVAAAAAAEERRRARERAARSSERKPAPAPQPPSDPDPAPAPDPQPPSGGSRGEKALAFAKAQLGEPYVYGADGPDSWDCSGLTMGAWGSAGVSLPHSSRSQYAESAKISRSQLQPGDLVLFYSDRHHVGLYAGGGKVIHAPRPGKSVEYINMDYMPYAGAVRPG